MDDHDQPAVLDRGDTTLLADPDATGGNGLERCKPREFQRQLVNSFPSSQRMVLDYELVSRFVQSHNKASSSRIPMPIFPAGLLPDLDLAWK